MFGAGYTTYDSQGNPQTDFANLYISIEWPYDTQHYPSVWVDFDPEGELTRGGIDEIATYIPSEDGTFIPLYLWRAQGWTTYSIATLSNMQRARLTDELLRVFAFNGDPVVNPFRSFIENNPYIAMNMDFDRVAQRGKGESFETPWGTEEPIYEITLAIQTVIEFYSTANKGFLYPLAEVDVYAQNGLNQGQWNDFKITNLEVTYGNEAPPA